MSCDGLRDRSRYAVVLDRARDAARRVHGARLRGQGALAQKLLGPLERLLYRLSGVEPERRRRWQRYAVAADAVQLLGILVVYGLQRLQAVLAAATRTSSAPCSAGRVQHRGQLRDEHQLAGLRRRDDDELPRRRCSGSTVQNFVSAATGMAVLVALIRGFTRKHADELGNFWVDLTRSTLYILLPLSIVLALVPRVAGRRADVRRRTRRHAVQPTTTPTAQPYRAGHRARARPRRRSRSSSSARTAAASST